MPTDMKLPEVGEGIEAGTVVAVLVKVGDRVELEQPILELETDKAVVEVPSTVAGVVEKVHVKANAEARIGQVVLTVGEGAAAPAEAKTEKEPDAKAEPTKAEAKPEVEGEETKASAATPAQEPSAPAPAPAPAAEPGRPGLIAAAPSVRRLARELDVDLRAVAGSGVLGRVSAEDVQRYATGGPGAGRPGAVAVEAPPLPDFSRWGETERVAMSGIRKVTVRTMAQAWANVPMVTHFDEADATRFEELRQRFKGMVEKVGAKLTPTAMLLKVIAVALRRFPDFNASIDVGTQEIVYKKYVNLGTAVDTEHGLLVPVIKHADQKSVVDLAVELGEIAEKARKRKLTPDDMSGGNFIVSNLGGIGGTGFTPIVTPPDVAILGVSRSAMKPVWDAKKGEFAARLMMPLALTYDHRLIDGASAARFLRWVCQAVEEPYLLTLEG
ncbi:MAG TPA: 2-oxo acid dehydrogenase subunit E2 [Thermoleophilia bacterium]|nr:2-oxo acid dehydrogenase subunit E2 [Thermoleophilia bacterium]